MTLPPEQSVPSLIRLAATSCNHSHLDETILNRDPMLTKFAEQFCEKDPETDDAYSRLIDIPVTAVIGLQHLNFLPNGVESCTWREAVGYLEMPDWDLAVLRYLEGEMRHHAFPVSSKEPTALELRCVGGAVFCENGAHRLVAATAWLLKRHPNATLPKTRTRLLLPRAAMVSKLIDLAKRSAVMEYAEVPFSTVFKVKEFTGHLCSHVVRTTQETGESYYGVSSRQGLVDYNVAKHRATKFDTSGLKFEPIPRQLLRAWADNRWLDANFRSAEVWKNGANPDKVVSILY